MEEIIKKAIEGGYEIAPQEWGKPYFEYYTNLTVRMRFPISSPRRVAYTIRVKELVLDPLFWQSLSKALKWEDSGINMQEEWHRKAIHFMEMNFTYGWDKAVEYLSELAGKGK